MKVIAYSLPLMSLLGMFSIVATDDLYCTGSFDESGRPPPNTRCNGDCIKDSGRWGSSYCYTANGNWGAECVLCIGCQTKDGQRCKFPFIGEDGREYDRCTDTKNDMVPHGAPWCRTDCPNPPCPAKECNSDCPTCKNCAGRCHDHLDGQGNPCGYWWDGQDCHIRLPMGYSKCKTAGGDVITCGQKKDSLLNIREWKKEKCGKDLSLKPCDESLCECKCRGKNEVLCKLQYKCR